MVTMRLCLPEGLKDFVHSQVKPGYRTSGEYVRELIRRDQDRQRQREVLLAGAISPATGFAGRSYFQELRKGVRGAAKVARGTGR